MTAKFDWNEYLEFAQDCFDAVRHNPQFVTQRDECKYRNSVSRAYYAAYNIADAYAKTLSYNPPQNADHKALSDYFAHLWLETNKEVFDYIAEDLKTMRSKRNGADYYLRKTSRQDAADCLEMAKEVIADINSLRAGSI